MSSYASSYTFSQNHNLSSVMAGAGAILWACLRTLAIVLGLAVALAAVFAVVVAFWLPICQVIGAGAIIAAFGWATYPRTRAPRSGWGA